MNVTESNAVCVLLRFIGHEPSRGFDPPEDRDVVTAFRYLAEQAGKRLQVTQFPEAVPASVDRFLARLRAADSNGAGQGRHDDEQRHQRSTDDDIERRHRAGVVRRHVDDVTGGGVR